MRKQHIFQIEEKKTWRTLLPQILIAAGVVAVFVYGFLTVPKAADDKMLEATERAINTALTTCYAMEGFYPQDISYLEEFYGLQIEYNKFNVSYNKGEIDLLLGKDNTRPVIKVTPVNETESQEEAID